MIALSIAASVPVVAASARVSGEPSTTDSAPSSTAAKRSTSTTLGFPPYPVDEPNPLTLYPGRPGAKYGETEARPNASVSFGLSKARVVGWSRRPHSALPAGSTPAPLGAYSSAGLVDGYSPSSTHDPGDVLRVVLHVVDALSLGIRGHCVATAASDGVVLVPYAQPPHHSRPTTSTLPDNGTATNLVYFLPLGARHGRVYFTCDFRMPLSADGQPVWGLDV